MDLRGKKVTVVGLGKSGVAAAKLLLEKGAKVSVTDSQDSQGIRGNVRSLNKKNIVGIEIGRHTEDLIEGRDLVVVSPGVDNASPPILWAGQRGIPVIGEIELAFAFCPAPVIAITGTNGKTTVSTLIGQILKTTGRKCIVCGNIGNPFSAEVRQASPEHIVVLEVSSFQLETIDRFKPKVAVVLNLSDDHLDRHKDFEQYLAAKSRIFSNQDEGDWAILNEEDPLTFALAARTKAGVLYFSNNKCRSLLGKLRAQGLEYKIESFNNNHFAAIIISSLFDIAQEKAMDICLRFKGLEHRMEEVGQIGGVKFINDSKATNVTATFWALNSINQPVVLIAGGRDKGSDFSAAGEKIKEKVRALILFGQAKEKMEQAFNGLVLTRRAETLPQALRQAASLARPGDCVLLSPMCASFDMFSDYAERGRAFKGAVKNLTQNLM